AEILSERFVTPQCFESNIITLNVNQDIDPDELCNILTRVGYVRVQQVEMGGQYARRGDVVDVFPINSRLPYRLYFFDTVIENIKSFNVISQFAIDEYDTLQLCPNGYSILPEDAVSIANNIELGLNRASKRVNSASNPHEYLSNLSDLNVTKENIRHGITLSTWGYYSVWSHTVSILDYLPNSVICIDQPKQVYQSIVDYQNRMSDSIQDAINTGLLLDKHSNLLIDIEEITERLKKFTCVAYQNILTANKMFEPNNVISMDCMVVPKVLGNWEQVGKELDRLLDDGYKVVLNCTDANDAMALEQTLQKYGKKVNISNSQKDWKENTYNIIIAEYVVGFCFVDTKVVVLGRQELNLRRESKKTTTKNNRKLQEEFSVPSVGEYVVHDIHGIGVCEGVKQLTINNAVRDYLVISYKNNDKLYVPTEQFDMLSRYVGAEKTPTLNIIGGAQFEKIKSKVRGEIKELAFDLLALYREREKQKGVKLSVSADIYKEIDDTFRYELTKDQQEAINDIMRDMASGRIMDRLVVGDVGYGKTEVALRAAFVAAMCGKQVAVLAPTTILSEQHYNTFSSRLKGFGIEIRCLNRFKSRAEQKEILQELKDGKVNIVCGTHRLLSNDVQFFDLGLLILDEEQRFGVGDKEKIKTIKKNVHVLTLSATPIPRTLHMSLVGIRDISIIGTPPVDRLPVQTMVMQYNHSLITTAVRKELDRQGQVLVVYPRVETIDEFASKLSKLLGGDVRIGIAHGQMHKDKLEDIMVSVYRGEIDVLVATSLIENGIDLPNANTIFVISADLFGLSQLYQLRGRVGRGNKLAYAYFTYMDEARLSDTSYLRLSTLMEFTQLGSGIKIAMRDLEMRGAGNLLGAKQHGQMEKVGYDMYCKLLDMEINELRGVSVVPNRGVKLEIDWGASIPQKFTAQDTERMELYSMIVSINTMEDYEDVICNIRDKYGSVPENVVGLCKVALLKTMCIRNGIERCILTNKKVAMYVALDNTQDMDNIMGKLNSGTGFKVYKKDNWAIFELQNVSTSAKNYDKVIKMLNV
ncbi:MAG: transcription-repair coupling factor, partial [Clostridia bacterium]|nr:transcription-repair coupling factor [Clostridia bacterium]